MHEPQTPSGPERDQSRAQACDAVATVGRAAAGTLDPRTRKLLDGALLPTLIRLAAPNTLVTLVQASIGLIEAYFIGKLGTEALAGASLVFPGFMLMQMMSAGAMGGGISSAVARALGAGRREQANALVLHAITIALGFGIAFTAIAWLAGPWLYAALGGSGLSFRAALTYSNILFGGAVLVWLFNSLASVVRGTGNMIFPAIVTCAGAAILLPVSPALIFGWGPFPRLGIAGGAWAILSYYGLGSIAFALYLRSGKSVVRLSVRGAVLRWVLFREILRVGAVAALITLQTNVTIFITTGLVGTFGASAIAGYGAGARLEYLLVPLVFGLGAPLVALVGTNMGAGQQARALKSAWLGAAIAGLLTEAIGISAALWPYAWIALFGSDPAMLEAGSRYLQAVGPTYGFFGVGMALYFASQGAGRLLWPLLAGLARLLTAAGGGWLALRLTGDLTLVFLATAAALAAFGLINSAAVTLGSWNQR